MGKEATLPLDGGKQQEPGQDGTTKSGPFTRLVPISHCCCVNPSFPVRGFSRVSTDLCAV
jgi:hypothetical protein